ncbi:hypothetical protein IHQ71_08420 [Rhizobium sp. TH2]|uniref:hypothetical protein n=1 Tax=Rhizobium sp. TH2 TaxID=2775403 RepID=UPI002157C7D9|nr:hypothetical protein [Rhizobium sp. TH2]UVC10595.1 hypothetical protein IHQ71_08420 [Rhizobium sp. TH2]
MTAQGYPEQYDVMWAATDSIGQVGVFFSAGEGPIAKAFLDYEGYEQKDLGGRFGDPPPRGELIRVGGFGDDSVYELAERGCYVFDWSDVHRGSGKLHAYELCAMPSAPWKLSELALDVQTFLGQVQLPGVVFGTSNWLDVEAHAECLNTRYRMPFDDLPVRKDGPPVQYAGSVGARTSTLQSLMTLLQRLLPR